MSAVVLSLWISASIAQQEDLTLPPRFDESPGEVRFAEPAENRDGALEEIVVVNQSEWRLPDLGSAWRARQESEQTPERIQVSFLPLYDPEDERVDFDPLRINRELQQVGFLRLFNIRFGRRSRD